MDVLEFDLLNQNHLAIRRMMADIYSRFIFAICHQNYQAAQRYSGMASGLVRVSLVLLNDIELFEVCLLLEEVLQTQFDLHYWQQVA